jgi:polyphosphate kinase 2
MTETIKSAPPKMRRKDYDRELRHLQVELVKLQHWVKERGLRVVVLFEGRDAAGKGGVIKRITQTLNPRVVRTVALGIPTEYEKNQWWFQRYVDQLPARGEMVLFDRSWYNRALVEPVMGFCTPEQYEDFLDAAPDFERLLIKDGIVLIKYWFSISDEAQERRFQARGSDPLKRWKLSDLDLKSRAKWADYSQAKDRMFSETDTEESPWFVVEADVKRHARLNCIHHLLSLIPHDDLTPPLIDLPPRPDALDYERSPMDSQTHVPEVYPGKFATDSK